MSNDSLFNFSHDSECDYFDQSLRIWNSDYIYCDNGDISLLEPNLKSLTSWPMDIHTAASIGCCDWIKKNISDDCNRKNLGGWTALMYACHAGYLDVVKFLINCEGCRINELNGQGHTPLILAASCGNEDLVEALLEKGAELESADVRGQTALYHATIAGHQTVVRLLVDKHANYNVADFQTEMTPFMEAVVAANEIIVQFFLYKGVDLAQQNSKGQTALDIATLRGHTKITKIIQDHMLALKKAETQKINRIENSNLGSKDQNSRYICEGPQAINNLLSKISKQPNSQKPMVQVQALRSQVPRRDSPVAMTIPNNTLPTSANTIASNSPNAEPTTTDLKLLLHEIGLSKYLPIFEEQDVDLMVFLTLDDKDLKELGINLLGPRKKIMMAISRWREAQQAARLQGNEGENQFKQLSLQLMLAEQSNKKLSQDLQREEQLRSLVENCVVTERSTNQLLVDRINATKQNLQEIIINLRSNPEIRDLDKHLENIYHHMDNIHCLNK